MKTQLSRRQTHLLKRDDFEGTDAQLPNPHRDASTRRQGPSSIAVIFVVSSLSSIASFLPTLLQASPDDDILLAQLHTAGVYGMACLSTALVGTLSTRWQQRSACLGALSSLSGWSLILIRGSKLERRCAVFLCGIGGYAVLPATLAFLQQTLDSSLRRTAASAMIIAIGMQHAVLASNMFLPEVGNAAFMIKIRANALLVLVLSLQPRLLIRADPAKEGQVESR